MRYVGKRLVLDMDMSVTFGNESSASLSGFLKNLLLFHQSVLYYKTDHRHRFHKHVQ